MSTAVVLDTPAELSPRAKARLAGAFYLLTILLGGVAEGGIGRRMIVPSDAAATAANILGHETLYGIGFTLYLVELACQITMTALLYDLLKPAGRSVSRLAAIFGLVGCGI